MVGSTFQFKRSLPNEKEFPFSADKTCLSDMRGSRFLGTATLLDFFFHFSNLHTFIRVSDLLNETKKMKKI